MKRTILSFVIGFISFSTYGQTLPCDKIAAQIADDTTKSIWDWNFDSIPHETYYCLGKYFAKRDIENKIFRIQTYGNPDWDNPCKACKYEMYGFKYEYHWDIIYSAKTKFIEGYNEVSLSYLKAKIGDSLYARLDDTPKYYFNPREVLNKNLFKENYSNLFRVSVINDTSILVKLHADSLFKEYPQYVSKINYQIRYYNDSTKTTEVKQYLSSSQIQNTGFVVIKNSGNRYYFDICFDFGALANEEKYCSCALTDPRNYCYRIPIIVK